MVGGFRCHLAARVGLVTASKGPDHKSRPTLNPLISRVPSYKRTPKVAKKVAKKVGPKEEVEVVTADGLSFERRRNSTPGHPGCPAAAVPTLRCGLENARSHDSESGRATLSVVDKTL